jgi:hypothetical protein
LPIAERDEQREAMQPGAVEVTERGAQPIGLALVSRVARDGRLMSSAGVWGGAV